MSDVIHTESAIKYCAVPPSQYRKNSLVTGTMARVKSTLFNCPLHKYCVILAVVIAANFAAAASDNITSFSAPLTVNDFLRRGDTLFIATSGGLRVHNLANDSATLAASSKLFPDLHLTALAHDADGNLWIGSRRGFLYRRTPRGQYTTFSNYATANWDILTLRDFGAHIIVGSSRGASIFDPARGTAVRNATQIATFTNPRVNAIAASANRDTLFLGGEEGVVYLDGLTAHPLASRNFYDAGIWKIRSRERAASFLQTGNTVTAHAVPSAQLRGSVITAEAAEEGHHNFLVIDGRRSNFTVPSTITKMFTEDIKRLWIGTTEDFYYAFDGMTPPERFNIEGMVLRNAARVNTAPNGDVWLNPVPRHRAIFWHHGVQRFDGANWHLYSSRTHGDFGYAGDNEALGFAHGLGGTVWIGTWGGNLKHIDPARNTVRQLVFGNSDFQNFYLAPPGHEVGEWGKSDAVATDSSGYLWIAVFDSHHGSLICYDQRHPPNAEFEHDPRRARFRRFFTEPPLRSRNISLLHVDADNRIFAYDDAQTRLMIFTHDGDPLANGIDTLRTLPNIGVIRSITGDANGDTYMSGSGGILRIRRNSFNIETVDNTVSSASGIVVRDGVAWVGTHTDGVLRYDLASGAKRWIDMSSGMPSNSVSSVAMDDTRGHLWAVTDEGVSRIDIGRAAEPARSTAMRVFPNVFSVSGGNQGVSHITFASLRPRSVVSIYTVSGALVARAPAREFDLAEGGGGGVAGRMDPSPQPRSRHIHRDGVAVGSAGENFA